MNPVTQPPYPWAEAVRIGITEPGHTIISEHFAPGTPRVIPNDSWLLPTAEETLNTLFSTWDASYPNQSGRN